MTSPTHSATPPAAAGFNPWPISIIATFVIFISGTIGLVILSARDRNDLVSSDYYEQEIRYQARMDQIQRTEPFTTQIHAAYDPAQKRITLSLPSQHAAAGASGKIHLYRPDHSGADQSFPIDTNPDGIQDIPAADLQPGLWKVQLHWTASAQEYYADRQVVVRPELKP